MPKMAFYPTRAMAVMVARYYLDTEIVSPKVTENFMGHIGKTGYAVMWPLRVHDEYGREIIIGYTFLHVDGKFHNAVVYRSES